MATQIDPAFKSAWRESQGQPVDSEVLNRRAAAPQEPAPEPAAWREKDFASGRYVYGSPKEVRAAHGVGAIVEPIYASPQPANPAQVADAIRSIVEDALNSAIPETWEVAEHATQRILAAIGAGGQAVAWWHVGKWGNGTSCADESNIFCDAWETPIATNLPTEIAEAIVEAHNAALSQPHPADERVVEALTICPHCDHGIMHGYDADCPKCDGTGKLSLRDVIRAILDDDDADVFEKLNDIRHALSAKEGRS